MIKRIWSAFLALALCLALSPAAAAESDGVDAAELAAEWKQDQDFALADPAPWNLNELKQVVDVTDPRSVAAYWVWAVTRLTDSYDDGMAMMKYLFADIEPYGGGFTAGGMSGLAGWDAYFNERLTDPEYRWLPRAYFRGAEAANGFKPARPLTVELYYNQPNTETINAQTLDSLGRLNIVYWVMSNAGGHQVNIVLSRFADSDRWYVTSGTSSAALFYDQRSALGATDAERQEALSRAAATPTDESTAEEHEAFYAAASILSFAPAEGDLLATVRCAADTQATALCATYDGEGRLLSAEARRLTAGQDNSLTLTRSAAGTTARLFVLGSDFAPLCAPKTLALN